MQGQLRTARLPKVSKDFFATLDDDYIISERLYNCLKEEKVKLGELNRILNYRNIELPFYHLYSTLTLPPATKKEGLTVEGQCSECKRNGYFNTAIFAPSGSNVPTKYFLTIYIINLLIWIFLAWLILPLLGNVWAYPI